MTLRRQLLRDLIELNKEPNYVLEQLSKYNWDIDEPIASLAMTDVIRALQEYVNQKLSEKNIEDWANAIEVREDIEFDDQARSIIHILANPVLSGPLTKDWARQQIEKYYA